jgi:arsenate reductase-like glutaredoxin family protein
MIKDHYDSIETAKAALDKKIKSLITPSINSVKEFDEKYTNCLEQFNETKKELIDLLDKFDSPNLSKFLSSREDDFRTLKGTFDQSKKKIQLKDYSQESLPFLNDYISKYEIFEKLYRHLKKFERKYYGWVRYYSYEKNHQIHLSKNCQYFKKVKGIVFEYSGVPFQRLDPTDKRLCSRCIPIPLEKSDSHLCAGSGRRYITTENLQGDPWERKACEVCGKYVFLNLDRKFRKHKK